MTTGTQLQELLNQLSKARPSRSLYVLTALTPNAKKTVFDPSFFNKFKNKNALINLINHLAFSGFAFRTVDNVSEGFSDTQFLLEHVLEPVRQSHFKQYEAEKNRLHKDIYLAYMDLNNGDVLDSEYREKLEARKRYDEDKCEAHLKSLSELYVNELNGLKTLINFALYEQGHKTFVRQTGNNVEFAAGKALFKQDTGSKEEEQSLKEVDKDRIIDRFSHKAAWIMARLMAVGEGVVPGVGVWLLLTSFAVAPHIALPVAVIVGISGFIANVVLVEKAIQEVSEYVMREQLFKDADGEEIRGGWRFVLKFVAVMTVTTGLVYAALSGQSLVDSAKAPLKFTKENVSIALALLAAIVLHYVFPAGTFIGITCAFGVAALVIVKRYYAKYKAVKGRYDEVRKTRTRWGTFKYALKSLFSINPTVQHMSVGERVSYYSDKAFHVIKLAVVLSVDYVVALISFGVFKNSISKYFKNNIDRNLTAVDAGRLGEGVAGTNVVISSAWGYSKMRSLTETLTFRDVLKTLLKLPVMVTDYVISTVTFHHYRAQMRDLNLSTVGQMTLSAVNGWPNRLLARNVAAKFKIVSGVKSLWVKPIVFLGVLAASPFLYAYDVATVAFDMVVVTAASVLVLPGIRHVLSSTINAEAALRKTYVGGWSKLMDEMVGKNTITYAEEQSLNRNTLLSLVHAFFKLPVFIVDEVLSFVTLRRFRENKIENLQHAAKSVDVRFYAAEGLLQDQKEVLMGLINKEIAATKDVKAKLEQGGEQLNYLQTLMLARVVQAMCIYGLTNYPEDVELMQNLHASYVEVLKGACELRGNKMIREYGWEKSLRKSVTQRWYDAVGGKHKVDQSQSDAVSTNNMIEKLREAADPLLKEQDPTVAGKAFSQHQVLASLIYIILNSGGQGAMMEEGGTKILMESMGVHGLHSAMFFRVLGGLSEFSFSMAGNYDEQKAAIKAQGQTNIDYHMSDMVVKLWNQVKKSQDPDDSTPTTGAK